MKSDKIADSMAEDEILALVESHVKNPQFQGTLKSPTIRYSFHNPFCADDVHFDIELSDNRVTQIRFQATGCVLSRAAADLVCSMIEGRSLEEIRGESAENVLSMIGGVAQVRKNCALFGFEGIQKNLAML